MEITTHQAKTQLSQYLKHVEEEGAEYLIKRGNVPVARLVPLLPIGGNQRPKVGTITSGPIQESPDAFEPLSKEELKSWGF